MSLQVTIELPPVLGESGGRMELPLAPRMISFWTRRQKLDIRPWNWDQWGICPQILAN